MTKPKRSVIVVGGGLAGLSVAYMLCEKNIHVTIVSVTACKRSHSVCAQGGINAAVNTMGENDSPLIHAYDTIKGGDFLADQPPIVEMCYAAPKIIHLLDRMGCPFNRTSEGNLDFRRFGGTLYHRTAFCGASTGQQLLYALDEQVRRFEAKGLVTKMETHEFLRVIRDDHGVSRGIVYMDLFNHKIATLQADAVVLATGGPGLIFKKSTNSTFCTGAANARAYQQGMWYANGEFIQIHPTAIPGSDKLRLMSESARGEGGRVWVYGDSTKTITTPSGETIPCGKTGEPWYFLEELYPAFGNLVPRDIGAREILRVVELGLGIDQKMQVYLDVSHLNAQTHQKLGAILEIYEKFTGEDPRKTPMRIFPAVHYSMGGGYVDWPASQDVDRQSRFRHMTNIPGLFNVGESDFAYHGANRLGANSLLSCIYGGLVTGLEIPRYLDTVPCIDNLEALCRHSQMLEIQDRDRLLASQGEENPFMLHEKLAEVMIEHVTVKRSNQGLDHAYQEVLTLRERFKKIALPDSGRFVNQSLIFAKQLGPMFDLSLVMIRGARLRDEFRGSHFKEGFTERDDKNFLKTTLASYDPVTKEPKMSYKEVDTRYFVPVSRDYTQAKQVQPELKQPLERMELPL